jgi:Domain of unknown function (DUF4384)
MKKLWLLIPVLVIVLASCRIIVADDNGNTSTTVSGGVYISFGVPVVNLITEFQPDRGRGGSYAIGERIAFRVGVRRSGYITMAIYDNTGTVNVLGSEAVSAGTNTLPIRYAFVAGPPSGRSYVRAFFSSTPRVYDYAGRGYTTSVWDQNTQRFLQSLPEDSRDVRETYVDVR